MSNNLQLLRLQTCSAGRTSTYEVPGGTVLVGSGSHCDVRLLPHECAPEQLRIEISDGEVRGRSLAPERECRLDGVRFTEGRLKPDAELVIGDTVLRVQRASGPLRRSKDKSSDGLPAVVRVLSFAGLAIGFYVVLHKPQEDTSLRQSVPAPSLFAEAIGACPAASETDAAFQARRAHREAVLRRERGPFYAQDGVRAVALYEQASACFEGAGDTGRAGAARQAATLLRQALQDEFHVRQVRLERFLNSQKYGEAYQEIRVLQDFLHQKDSPYARWLSAVQRELNTRFASAEKKAG